MSKNASRGFFGSLGFRVLSISCIFLAVPLVVYSLILYFIDYRQHVKNVYQEIDIISKEEIAWLHEKEVYYTNTIQLIEEFISTFHIKEQAGGTKELTDILRKFTTQQSVEAIIYAEVNSQNQLICKSSTVEDYVGVDFTKYFTIGQLRDLKDNVFIAVDPLYGYSMFIVQYIDSRGTDAYVMTLISLDILVTRMERYQNKKYLDISFVDPKGNVLASTNKEFRKKRFTDEKGPGLLKLREVSYIENAHYFYWGGQKNFYDARKLPKSEIYLVFTVPESEVMGRFQSFIYELGFFLLVVVIIGGLATFLFTIRMGRPMKNLTKVMEGVGGGDLQQRYEHDKYGFEINRLGDTFNQMTVHLIEYIEEAKKERGLKESFEKELQIGHQIQRALLPSEEKVIEGIDIASFYSPAKEVAGDFYDYESLSENKTMVTIADGVGKGISSCLYSFDLRSILKTAAHDIEELSNLVSSANNMFCKDTKESCNFVTAVIGFLDRQNKVFEFTNAGHLPVIVKKKEGVETFTTKGIALGIEELENVEVNKVRLQEGDYCVLYTDGVSEAQDKTNSLYTEERLLERVKGFNGESSREMIDWIMEDVKAFVSDVEQFDDITLLVFKFQSS